MDIGDSIHPLFLINMKIKYKLCIMAFNFNDVKTDTEHSSNVVIQGAKKAFLASASPFEILNAAYHRSYYCRGFKADTNPFGYKNLFWINKQAGTEPRKYLDMISNELDFYKPSYFLTNIFSRMWDRGKTTDIMTVFEDEWEDIVLTRYGNYSYRLERDLGIQRCDNFASLSQEEKNKIHDHLFELVKDIDNRGLVPIHMELLKYYTNRMDQTFPSMDIMYSQDNGIYIIYVCDIKHFHLNAMQKKAGYPNIHFSFTGLQNYIEHYDVINDNSDTSLKKYNDLVNKKILKNYGLKVLPEYFVRHEDTNEYYKFFVEYKGFYKFGDVTMKTYLPSNVFKFYKGLLDLYETFKNTPGKYKYKHHIVKSPDTTSFNLAYESEDGKFKTYIEEVDREQKIHRHVIKIFK